MVCRHCERWNLSPLEERWEAIEEAERLYRDTRRRVATDNIGLAKLRDGTTIVRIGEPLRPEFAAWRYGDQFGRRRVRQLAIVGAGLGALGAIIAGGAVVGVGVGSFAWMIGNAGKGIVRGSPETVVAKIKAPNGEVMSVRRRHLLETSIEPGESSPLAVTLRYKNGQARFEGEQALHVASRIIPAANRFGGSKKTVAEAVSKIESAGSSERFLERLGSMSRVLTRAGLSEGVLDAGTARRACVAIHPQEQQAQLEHRYLRARLGAAARAGDGAARGDRARGSAGGARRVGDRVARRRGDRGYFRLAAGAVGRRRQVHEVEGRVAHSNPNGSISAMIVTILVGIIAGFLAGRIMKGSGYGLLMDLLLGVAGSFVGHFLFGLIGIYSSGFIGSILFAVVGASILIWLGRFLKSRR